MLQSKHNDTGKEKHNILKPLKYIQPEKRTNALNFWRTRPLQLQVNCATGMNLTTTTTQNKEELNLQETLDWN